MPTLGEKPLWKPGEPVAILVWAKAKMGKTHGAGTAPRPNFIDFDHGLITLQGKEFISKEGWKPDIRYFQPLPGLKDKRGVIIKPEAFDAACTYFDDEMKNHADKFDTWVCDTGTSLVEATTAKALYLLSGQYRGQSSETLAQAKATGLVLPKQQDFGAERSMTEQFIEMLLGSGKNVIILCHEYEESTPTGTVVSRGPLFTGKSRESIPKMFDEIYRLEVRKHGKDYQRVLVTQTDGINKVGSRLGVADGTAWHWDSVYAEMIKCYDLITQQKASK